MIFVFLGTLELTWKCCRIEGLHKHFQFEVGTYFFENGNSCRSDWFRNIPCGNTTWNMGEKVYHSSGKVHSIRCGMNTRRYRVFAWTKTSERIDEVWNQEFFCLERSCVLDQVSTSLFSSVLASHCEIGIQAMLSHETALVSACSSGNLSVVRDILALYPCLAMYGMDTKDSSFPSVLHVAAINGNVDIVQYLLDHGADWSYCNTYNENVFHIVANTAHVPLLECLANHNFMLIEKEKERLLLKEKEETEPSTASTEEEKDEKEKDDSPLATLESIFDSSVNVISDMFSFFTFTPPTMSSTPYIRDSVITISDRNRFQMSLNKPSPIYFRNNRIAAHMASRMSYQTDERNQMDGNALENSFQRRRSSNETSITDDNNNEIDLEESGNECSGCSSDKSLLNTSAAGDGSGKGDANREEDGPGDADPNVLDWIYPETSIPTMLNPFSQGCVKELNKITEDSVEKQQMDRFELICKKVDDNFMNKLLLLTLLFPKPSFNRDHISSIDSVKELLYLNVKEASVIDHINSEDETPFSLAFENYLQHRTYSEKYPFDKTRLISSKTRATLCCVKLLMSMNAYPGPRLLHQYQPQLDSDSNHSRAPSDVISHATEYEELRLSQAQEEDEEGKESLKDLFCNVITLGGPSLTFVEQVEVSR